MSKKFVERRQSTDSCFCVVVEGVVTAVCCGRRESDYDSMPLLTPATGKEADFFRERFNNIPKDVKQMIEMEEDLPPIVVGGTLLKMSKQNNDVTLKTHCSKRRLPKSNRTTIRKVRVAGGIGKSDTPFPQMHLATGSERREYLMQNSCF